MVDHSDSKASPSHNVFPKDGWISISQARHESFLIESTMIRRRRMLTIYDHRKSGKRRALDTPDESDDPSMELYIYSGKSGVWKQPTSQGHKKVLLSSCSMQCFIVGSKLGCRIPVSVGHSRGTYD